MQQTYTYAGICGSVGGFMDGPLGINQLNKPELVAVDEEGYLFIADGNGFVRMVQPFSGLKNMVTLQAGSCGTLEEMPRLQSMGLSMKQHFCFRKWVKNGSVSQPKEHYYDPAKQTTLCELHQVHCRQSSHPLVLNETISG